MVPTWQVCLGKVKAFDGFKQISGVTNLELLIEMKWSEALLKCFAKLISSALCHGLEKNASVSCFLTLIKANTTPKITPNYGSCRSTMLGMCFFMISCKYSPFNISA